ncbi:uncharacterized protein LOC112599210 [Melanaphis sacchari]|uniref:uncharacterized protein LOC112599210 n=1 Tax=Melanaphis sacchari TaxID=742174 RepID=UPI000DC12E96|nr:uncharacterized protein LOC112599210 [Melanaphis sacchari]
MDSFEALCDTDSSKTVILWANKVPLVKCTTLPLLENLHHRRANSYRVPTGISEHFSNSVIKASEDFVKEVISDSEQAVQCYLKMNKLGLSNSSYDSKSLMINKYVIQACKDREFSESNRSLFFNPSWLNENGIFDDQVAIENISVYIKQHWNLDTKYLYSVEKSLMKMIDASCHSYKAEFSVSTNEYPIPQVTVSAYFTVNVSHLLSLPAVYIKYQLETDRHEYVVGRHSFNKKHFERLFKTKRDMYMKINKYVGWSSGPSHSAGFNS